MISQKLFFSFHKNSANSNLKISKCPNLSKLLHPTSPHKVNFFRGKKKKVVGAFIMDHTVGCSDLEFEILKIQLDKHSRSFSKCHLQNVNFKVFLIANFLTIQNINLKFGVWTFSVSTRQSKKIILKVFSRSSYKTQC